MGENQRKGNGSAEEQGHNGKEPLSGKNGVHRLAGKVAVIRGPGRGIEQAPADKYGTESAKGVSCDISADRAQETVQLCVSGGGEATGFQMDVRDKASIARVVEEVVAKYGRVDCLVNNAGIV